MKTFHSIKNAQIAFILTSSVVIIGHALGTIWNWYNKFFLSDIVVHFAGGAWIALAFFTFLPFFRKEAAREKLVIILIFSSLFVGILWEIFEFSLDRYSFATIGFTPGFQGPPLDTLLDLIMDVLGGAVTAFYIKYFA